jgi:hypothetical protein
VLHGSEARVLPPASPSPAPARAHELSRERELLENCLQSWFIVGKLGGYNSQNLQVGRPAGGGRWRAVAGGGL